MKKPQKGTPVHYGKQHKAAHKKAQKGTPVHYGKQHHQKHHKAAKGTPVHYGKQHRAKAVPGVPSFGYVPDDPDERDRQYKAVSVSVSFVDLSKDAAMPPVWDQGDLGSCTAHGSLAAFLWAASKAGNTDPMLSRLQVYYNARALEGTTGEDAGAQVRDAIKACAKGVAPESDWPYDIERFADRPSAQAVTDASQNVAVEYLSVGRYAPALQACLDDGFPVVVGLTLYESFESQEAIDSGVVPYPRYESVLGGHCMAVVGIGYGHEWIADGQFPTAHPATRYVKLRNSWGTDVYQDGYLLMPAAYLHQHGQDFWTIRNAT